MVNFRVRGGSGDRGGPLGVLGTFPVRKITQIKFKISAGAQLGGPFVAVCVGVGVGSKNIEEPGPSLRSGCTFSVGVARFRSHIGSTGFQGCNQGFEMRPKAVPQPRPRMVRPKAAPKAKAKGRALRVGLPPRAGAPARALEPGLPPGVFMDPQPLHHGVFLAETFFPDAHGGICVRMFTVEEEARCMSCFVQSKRACRVPAPALKHS